jgi:hypothetical protein
MGGVDDRAHNKGDKMMALTLEAEQRLDDVGVTAFYDDDADVWLATVRATKNFVSGNFPAHSRIRRDDVAKALVPILEVHEGFKDFRAENKLRGKFWVKDFADLLIDKTWDTLEQEDNHGEE